jgi:hypothetical protein
VMNSSEELEKEIFFHIDTDLLWNWYDRLCLKRNHSVVAKRQYYPCDFVLSAMETLNEYP